MSDIALLPTRSDSGDTFDFALSKNDFLLEEGLRTAVIISLFTDKRVSKEEIQDGQEQKGWWADTLSEIQGDQIGSKLWLLEREKQTNEVLTRAIEYATEALAWLIEDEVASKVDVTASYPSRGILAIGVVITRPNGEKLNYAFDNAWKIEGTR
jgi:phage gp46-like protein